jgi:hypothetical protein
MHSINLCIKNMILIFFHMHQNIHNVANTIEDALISIIYPEGDI